MLPLINIVVPAYNAEGRIESTLRSIIAQDYKNIEIILVDDASTDATLAVSKKILSSCGRQWRIVGHDINRGGGAARNTGLKASEGEYVSFIDADDLVDENFVSVLYETVSKNGSDLAFCGFRVQDELSDRNEMNPVTLDPASSYAPEDLAVMRIFAKITSAICTFMFRVDFLKSNGLEFFEGCTAGEDVEFVIKSMSICESACFSPLCPYVYIKHAGMGSVVSFKTREQRLSRYMDNTNAHFRAASFLMERSKYSKVVDAAKNYLLPTAYIKLLTLYSHAGDLDLFEKTIVTDEVRAALRSSCKYFFKNPEVCLKSLCLLYLPSLYYWLRSGRTEKIECRYW
jgi:glycosyltransferase involved in cell wall biosynthesis